MKIAIYGPMCSGKTTVANIIQELDNEYQIYSFGQKIKDLASELFQMEGKDRTLLITIADKMRDIDEDVWAKYIIQRTKDHEKCIIDDLRFQNELNYLEEWKIICLTTTEEERIKREAERIAYMNSPEGKKEQERELLAFKKESARKSLIDISGINDKLARTLLDQFPDIESIKDASIEDLSDIPGVGKSIAKAIKARIG